MVNSDEMIPGRVYDHRLHGEYIFLARSGDDFIFSRGVCLKKELLFVLNLTSRVVSDISVGARSYNYLAPQRVIAKIFENLEVGDIVLVDKEKNLSFRVCVVQAIDLRKMTITCDDMEINIQSTEVYKTGYEQKRTL